MGKTIIGKTIIAEKTIIGKTIIEKTIIRKSYIIGLNGKLFVPAELIFNGFSNGTGK